MRIQGMISGIFIVLFSCPTMAYIDPSSGSAIISALIGIFVALSMMVKTYWYKIKSFFGSGDKANDKRKVVSEDIAEIEKKDV